MAWLVVLRPSLPPLMVATAQQPATDTAVIPKSLPTIESLAQPTPAPIPGRQAELWPGAGACFGWHAGATDWCAPQGTEVHAPASGTFSAQGYYGPNDTCGPGTSPGDCYGANMILVTDGGLEIYAGHLDLDTVNPSHWQPGQRVEAGQTLARLGWHKNGSHTHIQLRRGGELVSQAAWWGEWDAR